MVKILDEVECLNWYDGPLISIMNGDDGKLYYVHWGHCDDKQNVWMATPVTQDDIEKIKSGKVDINSILTRPETKTFNDLDMELTDNPIDLDMVPVPGVTLYCGENCEHPTSDGSKRPSE